MRRIHIVYKMIARGEPKSYIHQVCCENWGVDPRTVDVYVKAARDKLKEDIAQDRETFAIEMMANFREIRSAAFRSAQYGVALQAATKMAGLAQLDGFKHGNAK